MPRWPVRGARMENKRILVKQSNTTERKNEEDKSPDVILEFGVDSDRRKNKDRIYRIPN